MREGEDRWCPYMTEGGRDACVLGQRMIEKIKRLFS